MYDATIEQVEVIVIIIKLLFFEIFSFGQNQFLHFLLAFRKNFRRCTVSFTNILDDCFEVLVLSAVKIVNGVFEKNEKRCDCQDEHPRSVKTKQPPPIGKDQIYYSDNKSGSSSKLVNSYAIMYHPMLVVSYRLFRRNLVQIIIKFTYITLPQKP